MKDKTHDIARKSMGVPNPHARSQGLIPQVYYQYRAQWRDLLWLGIKAAWITLIAGGMLSLFYFLGKGI